jgi:hypothetical protein
VIEQKERIELVERARGDRTAQKDSGPVAGGLGSIVVAISRMFTTPPGGWFLGLPPLGCAAVSETGAAP